MTAATHHTARCFRLHRIATRLERWHVPLAPRLLRRRARRHAAIADAHRLVDRLVAEARGEVGW